MPLTTMPIASLRLSVTGYPCITSGLDYTTGILWGFVGALKILNLWRGYNGCRSPSNVGISSETVGWIPTVRCKVV
jgi:hypothetical protein